MLFVGICDDDKMFCEETDRLLLQIQEICGEELETEIFTDGEQLCMYFQQGKRMDLLLLDIEMEGLNGVQIGKIIRDTLENQDLQIVYVSSKESYAMQLFSVRPLDFVVKPVTYEKLNQIIQKTQHLLKHDNGMLCLEKMRQKYYIKIRSILYIEVYNRKVSIHTLHGIEEFYGRLSEIKKQVEKFRFIQINRSVLVNYDMLLSYSVHSVILENGDELDISRTRKESVEDAFIRYGTEDSNWNI